MAAGRDEEHHHRDRGGRGSGHGYTHDSTPAEPWDSNRLAAAKGARVEQFRIALLTPGTGSSLVAAVDRLLPTGRGIDDRYELVTPVAAKQRDDLVILSIAWVLRVRLSYLPLPVPSRIL